jgi:glucose-6-phosphate 1-dehydrogenase
MNTTSIVIFGASGDLSQRKLIPGLFSLFRKGRLPEKLNILGFSSSQISDQDFRDKLQQGVEKFSVGRLSNEAWQDFAGYLYYQPGKFTSIEDFQLLAARLAAIEAGPANRLFYLATPPRFFPIIVSALGETGMTEETAGWRRVVIEKPFGTDAETARQLNYQLHQVLDEKRLSRIY